ncbi:MAG: ankyrin repeat domain-containing protein, partial [Akkermansia sp.]|nr:ankyrin repeat domain-containing protein [Akkermansia sp.]
NNIVHVTNVFRKLNTTYCVMEKIEGRNLAELYPINSQMEPQLLGSILRKLLLTLDFLHQHGLLHRDINPSNIILTPAGEPVLIDFAALHSMADLRDAELIGTPGYAPPEQMSDSSKCGPWTDIYALGATCYYLLTGQNPPNYHDRMFADPGSDLLAHRPELKGRFSPELLASIDKALALRAGDRWQSAQEWLEVIDTLMKPDSELLSHELPAGYKLHDYNIEDVLGQGDYGITYLATDYITGRKVVIKENFPAELSMRDSANHHAGPAGASRKNDYDWVLGSFLNEAKILARLKHPNIVPVLTAFKTLGTAYYVMDYIGGRSLHEAAPQQVTEQWLLGILRPMLSALHYIHSVSLLHRDIKPDNILITPEGTPILIDFGVARSSLATDGEYLVTKGYESPEQVFISNTEAPGPWTDIYALGATCYYLLTGQNPPNCFDRMTDETYRPLALRPELQGRFSPALLASIDKAFALRSTDRWQSAQEWLEVIDTLKEPDSELLSYELPVGYKLRDTYTLTETLGQGGFGITYLATEDVTERRVVVKENFPTDFAMRNSANHHAGPAGASRKKDYEWVLDKFLDEAKILTRLKHPNIVPVLTAFKALGTAYYVMDYIGGLPLHEAAPQQITEEWLLSILRPMLSALHYIHSLPEILLHLDIKPNNILVDPKGTPILIDFGAARSAIAHHPRSKCLITEGYSAPEQFSNTEAPGPWTDIYALGATCYYLLTGQNPPNCHARNSAAPDSDLLAFRPELQKRFSPALLSTIDKALTLRTTDRWQSAQEWMAAIDSIYNTTATPVNDTRVPTIEEPAPTPKITQQAAQAELQRRGISAGEYDSKLYDAAENGETELVKLLIAAGADVNKVVKDGRTPLYWAAIKGLTDCVKLLIAAGADVNKADEDGKTPLYKAVERDRTECVKLLIAAGADVNKEDKYGTTPLYRAVDKGHTECVKLLIDAGADVNRAKDGHTPLHSAAYNGRKECMKQLIAAGADVNKANEFGSTPLHSAAQEWVDQDWAAKEGHPECMKLLINAGADVNKADRNGFTPLHWAASSGRTECVKLLIDAGADVNVADKKGSTPLHWAEERGHTECAELLRAAGDTSEVMNIFKRLFS